LLRLQALTWRKQVVGLERFAALRAAGHRVIVLFWHGKYAPLFALVRVPGACIFTSRSFRGDVISEICRRFGLRAVEIPDHGGDASLGLMRAAVADSDVAAIAIDGPLGPYHSVKRGAIVLASELGCVLLPISLASRSKRVATARWDRREVPRLFATVHVEAGEPITVPRGLDEEGIDAWSERVRVALEALDAQAELALRSDGPQSSSRWS
jgi:hypothetical protein